MSGIRIIISIIVIVFITGVFMAVLTTHNHSTNCKWVAPLKLEYVLCDDGKVRLK